MTEQEYRQKRSELEKEYKKKKQDLDKQFVLSNNNVKIGDIVSDENCTIRVQFLVLKYDFCGNPYLSYKGTRLTKKLEPYKSGDIAIVYKVKNHIKKEDLK